MKINTNSNVYIIIYSVVMVVIVAVLLAVASQSLSATQKANELNEKQQQIVKALVGKTEGVKYEDVVAKQMILDAEGNVVSEEQGDVFAALNKIKDTFAAKQYPIFIANDGCVVVPMYGAGLWGPIWGYIALKEDMNTVNGIVLAHQGETPGLGAEIATDKHQDMYKTKTIYEGDAIVGILLKKGGADASNPHEIDAITGGTKTSDGVTNMIKECLNYYKPYFDAQRQAASEAVAVAEGESNQLNTENNGK